MKEQRFFYNPQPESGVLPAEEAQHATRVLRLGPGDEIYVMDGAGAFHTALITEASNHRCAYSITSTMHPAPEWSGRIHLAVAPTKSLDRLEWLTEKAMEIGIDRMSLLDCRNSERHVVKTERLFKILVSAMKQSRKAWLPQLDAMEPFASFVGRSDLPPCRFIAHCHDPRDVDPDGDGVLPFLGDVLRRGEDALVLVGPEGDFSVDEVRQAASCGFVSVSLGSSRLRTETAALVATHLMRLSARNDV